MTQKATHLPTKCFASRVREKGFRSRQGSLLAAACLPPALGSRYPSIAVTLEAWIQRPRPNNDQTKLPVRFVRGRLKLTQRLHEVQGSFHTRINKLLLLIMLPTYVNFKYSIHSNSTMTMFVLPPKALYFRFRPHPSSILHPLQPPRCSLLACGRPMGISFRARR